MKKRMWAIGMVLSMILTMLVSLPVFAEEETITVPVEITGMYAGENAWAGATYTYKLIDGEPETGQLNKTPYPIGYISNGKYTFKYFPSLGRIANNEQAASFSYVTGHEGEDVVIPTQIGALKDAHIDYPEKEIVLYAQNANYGIFRWASSVNNAKIIIPEGVTKIPDCVFGQMDGGAKTEILLPSTLTTIGSNSFAMSSGGGLLTDIIIPDSVTAIGGNAFSNCRFSHLVVPAGVTKINSGTFAFMRNVTEVTLKGEVTEIGGTAFRENKALKSFTFEGKTAPTLASNTFQGAATNFTVYFPANGVGYDDEAFRSVFPAGVTFERLPGVPVALGVKIDGKNVVGETLTGIYEKYEDPMGNTESGSTATWRRADDKAFQVNVEEIKTEPISAGQTSSYTLTEEDNNKYIQFGVTPRHNGTELNVGDEAKVVFSEKIRMPITKPAITLLSPSNGYRMLQNSEIQLKAEASCDLTTITKIEYYVDGTLFTSVTEAPYTVNWTGNEIGKHSIYAKAYNGLGENTDSETAVIEVLDPTVPLEPVWAGKWSYDFSEFGGTAYDGKQFTSSAELSAFPGNEPPTVQWYSCTIESGQGEFGKEPGDYYMRLTSGPKSAEAARLYLGLGNLDKPVETLVAQADVAFTTTDENRYIFSYRTPKGPCDGFIFTNGGTIAYRSSGNKWNDVKDENGQNMKYETGVWYHLSAKFDFVNKEITYYIEDKTNNISKEIKTTPIDLNTFTSTSEISFKGTHDKSKSGTILIDNLFIGQEQETYVYSSLTSPKAGYQLKNQVVNFTGYAKDSRGNAIQKVEFYSGAEKIAETTQAEYNFTKELSPGVYNIVAKAMSSDGMIGESKPVRVVVDSVKVPSNLYGDNMILQRNKDIHIRGIGIDGTRVTVDLGGVTADAVVSGGKWDAVLPPQPAIKSTTLTITSSDGVVNTYHNVAVGEIILCNGQSNMAYELYKFSSISGQADKDYPDIRVFKGSEKTSGTPQTECTTGSWKLATQTNAQNFSGIGFVTGKEYYLSQNGEVPVGLIYAAVGGTNINLWVPNEAYMYDPDLKVQRKGATHYNTYVAPWRDFTIGHVIWYQGEANTFFSNNYEKMLTAYIDYIREDFRDESINFVIFQLPIYDYSTYNGGGRTAVGVREGEFNVSERLDNVATVVGVDTGEFKNIHPNDKLPLAQRCSLALQHFTNPDDETLVWKSPSFDHYVQDGNTMTIYFKDVAGGLKTKDGQAPRGFKIAGDDGIFKDVAVVLQDNTIVVDTSSVTGTPKVRYAFEDGPALVSNKSTLNLVNSGELPMAPFRTDTEKYHFKTWVDGVAVSDPYNYVPMIRKITCTNVVGGTAEITVNARDYDDTIAKVEVYADGNLLGEATKVGETEYQYTWNGATAGKHTLHAIATDIEGAVSTKQDSSFSNPTTVSPRKYTVELTDENTSIIHGFTNLSNQTISHFGGADGVKVSANIVGTEKLVVALYQGDSLVSVTTVEGDSYTFTEEQLKDVTEIRAFLMDTTEGFKPVSKSKALPR